LKISDFNNLNDPFELLGIELSDEDVRSALKKEKAQIAQKKGLVCFSSDWQNPVQWGHYSDNHKGLCLGFDINDEILNEIKYLKKRLASTQFFSSDKEMKLLTTKFLHWDYEKEQRIVVDLIDYSADDKGLYFIPFSEKLVLKEVIIGSESNLSQKVVAEKITSNIAKVKIFNSRAAFRDFKIVWNRKKSRQAYSERFKRNRVVG
jgi:hypothetical protein